MRLLVLLYNLLSVGRDLRFPDREFNILSHTPHPCLRMKSRSTSSSSKPDPLCFIFVLVLTLNTVLEINKISLSSHSLSLVRPFWPKSRCSFLEYLVLFLWSCKHYSRWVLRSGMTNPLVHTGTTSFVWIRVSCCKCLVTFSQIVRSVDVSSRSVSPWGTGSRWMSSVSSCLVWRKVSISVIFLFPTCKEVFIASWIYGISSGHRFSQSPCSDFNTLRWVRMALLRTFTDAILDGA